MMRTPHTLYLADQQLVFSDIDKNGGLQTVLSVGLDEEGYDKKFDEFLSQHKPEAIAVFVDLMSEEIKHESIPHINGKDRKLLLDRKFKALFSSADLTWTQHVCREKTGRRDDVYLLTGISLPVQVQRIFDILSQTQQKVVGVFSMPILQQRLNLVLPDNKQYLLISRVLGSHTHTNTFRQAYYKDRRLVVCRVNTVSASSGKEEFDQLFDEIERTHQFLSGTNQLDQDQPLSVISLLGEEDSARLFDHTAHVNIELRYANLSELSKKLGIKRNFAYTNLPKLMCEFAVGKKLKPHFHPPEISSAYKLDANKRRLTLSAVSVLIVSLLMGFGLWRSVQLQNEKISILETDIALVEQQKKHLSEQVPETEVPPKAMFQSVQLFREIESNSRKPDQVLEILARAYSGYHDLEVLQVYWINHTGSGSSDSIDGDDEFTEDFSSRINAHSQFGIIVRPSGNMTNRAILSRVESFSASLLQQPEITSVIKEESAIDIATSAQLEESFGAQEQAGKLPDFTLLVTM